jgi:hypothetical protein
MNNKERKLAYFALEQGDTLIWLHTDELDDQINRLIEK